LLNRFGFLLDFSRAHLAKVGIRNLYLIVQATLN